MKISAFVAAAFAIAATPALAEPVSARETATTICAACHGPDGNSAVPMFPKLAGLQPEYITKQLKEFMSGQRKSDVMAPIVANLKPEDIPGLAAYYSAQKQAPGTVLDARLAEEGQRVYLDGNEETGVPACIGCHHPQGVGSGIYPRLGGQHSTYMVQQLKNFSAGERSNDVSRFMRVIAKRLSEKEMQAVAEYLTGQEPK
jgi:cytochrome c553